MRIYSLKVCDDAKKDPGCAVVELSGLHEQGNRRKISQRP